jgi:serine/threonine protein kinase
MEGGRILGAPGGYGCAFTPPLLCQNGKVPYGKKSKVGKITEKRDAEREIQTANRLRKFPLAPNYFLLPEPDSCQPAEPEKQSEPDLPFCLDSDFAKRIPFPKLKQIFLPLGGKNLFASLHSSNLHPRGFDFFDFMRHMLEIGATLAISGVIHFDLHPGNILLDKVKVPRAIDFGRSFFSNQINKQTIREHTYGILFLRDDLDDVIINQQPPELDALQAIQAEIPKGDACRLTVMNIPALHTAQSILHISLVKSTQELLDFCKTSKAIQQKDMVELWKMYWPQMDAWSIGTLLLHLLKQQLLFPDFKESWNHRKEAVSATLQGLLHTSPRERLDCVQALSVFEPENAWLRRFGGAWLKAAA